MLLFDTYILQVPTKEMVFNSTNLNFSIYSSDNKIFILSFYPLFIYKVADSKKGNPFYSFSPFTTNRILLNFPSRAFLVILILNKHTDKVTKELLKFYFLLIEQLKLIICSINCFPPELTFLLFLTNILYPFLFY